MFTQYMKIIDKDFKKVYFREIRNLSLELTYFKTKKYLKVNKNNYLFKNKYFIRS